MAYLVRAGARRAARRRAGRRDEDELQRVPAQRRAVPRLRARRARCSRSSRRFRSGSAGSCWCPVFAASVYASYKDIFGDAGVDCTNRRSGPLCDPARQCACSQLGPTPTSTTSGTGARRRRSSAAAARAVTRVELGCGHLEHELVVHLQHELRRELLAVEPVLHRDHRELDRDRPPCPASAR